MIRRLLVLAVVIAVGFVVYSNRRHIAALAGLGSPEVQIGGGWHPVRNGFKQDALYTFADEMVSRNGEVIGQYSFKGLHDIEVTLDQTTATYTIAFPDENTMDWYQEVNGERKLARRWRR